MDIELGPSDFLSSFGCKKLSKFCLDLIAGNNFKLTKIQGVDRDKLIIEIIERILQDTQVVGAPNRTDVWFNGWAENLNTFRAQPDSEDTLLPKFIREKRPIRWMKEYWLPHAKNFEKNYIEVLQSYIFTEFMDNCDSIYEFGAGTGHNLLAASKIYPEKKLFGTDFVGSAVELIGEVGQRKGINLKSEIFDMLEPNYEFRLNPSSGVLTFGALEQLSGNLDNIFDYFVKQPAEIYVHVEPSIEFYDPNYLEDYLAALFQGRRKYSDGLISRLKKMEQKGEIDLLKCRRLGFGSLMMEGYNLFVWKKKKS